MQLLGKTRIGAGCTIRTGSILVDATLEDGVLVKPYSVDGREPSVAAARRWGRSRICATARDSMENARVGNFVEVKKSVLGEGVKAMHLSYLGDARVGSGTNIGAGTITCNYDGVHKNPTTIGKRVFIGSDTALVAPGSRGRRRLHRRGIGDHRKRAGGRTGAGARPAGEQAGLGRRAPARDGRATKDNATTKRPHTRARQTQCKNRAAQTRHKPAGRATSGAANEARRRRENLLRCFECR